MAFPTYIPYQQNPGYYQPQATYQPPVTYQPPAPAQTAGYICRPVTSREEALGVQVDFFGPGTVMPDLGHGVIYLKRFNQQTGGCDLISYFAEQVKEEAKETPRYATMEDLEKLRQEILKKAVTYDAE